MPPSKIKTIYQNIGGCGKQILRKESKLVLEPKDFEMIAEIVVKSVDPIKNDIGELKGNVEESS